MDNGGDMWEQDEAVDDEDDGEDGDDILDNDGWDAEGTTIIITE